MHRTLTAAALGALLALAACGDAPAPSPAPADEGHAAPADLPAGVAFETVRLAISGMG